MYKILISGYYGFGNIGDESILTAVLDNMREKLSDISITVLSKDPQETSRKYDVNAVNRKSFFAILLAIMKCDLLVSGGGSLLQDVTSKRSILYYLFIIFAALLFRKKVIIYSQGIGPINSKKNRKFTAAALKRVHGIVVRDSTSKELLVEIGVPEGKIQVTADPVLRVRPESLAPGMKILEREGFDRQNMTGPVVGFAIRDRKMHQEFLSELVKSMERLHREYDATIVLIPFHYSEDMPVIEELKRRLTVPVIAVQEKYLTTEMLSIIGNMDLLVGVRLHALIYAAVMGVPMIGISYDPKINSFLHTLEMKAMSSTIDFKSDFFMEEFEKTMKDKDEIKAKIGKNISVLKEKLDKNEEMIEAFMSGRA